MPGRTLTLFVEASLAKISPERARGRGSKENGPGFGESSDESSARSAPDSSSSRTSKAGSRVGCVRCAGTCTCLDTEAEPWGLPPVTSARRTGGRGSSYLPTVSATSYGSSQNGDPHDHRDAFAGKGKPSLETMARRGDLSRLPSLTRSDGRSGARALGRKGKNGPTLTQAIGGLLNPTWAEWYQGFPEGWTDVSGSKPSEIASSRSARKKSAK